ncbi:MAG TPA: hypothetical protein VFZ53_11155 [Polyangiaceae bacterium]
MSRIRYLWLLVPALGIGELVLHVVFARRAPRVEEWRELVEPVRRLKRPNDLLVVAPAWAEPVARHALGDAPFPLDQVARADASSFPRALEISALGARADETRSWGVASEERAGRFTLRVLHNPAPVVPKYRFIEHVAPESLEVAVVAGEQEVPCAFTPRAPVTAGGLHGHVTFPRERFLCPGGEASFVGVTVIDDEKYLPRRCIWAHPPDRGELRLRFRGVPLGVRIRGWAGLSYFLFRDGVGEPVTIEFSTQGRSLGEHEHHDEWGFRAFTLPTQDVAGSTADVEISVRASSAANRHFCFVAETS